MTLTLAELRKKEESQLSCAIRLRCAKGTSDLMFSSDLVDLALLSSEMSAEMTGRGNHTQIC